MSLGPYKLNEIYNEAQKSVQNMDESFGNTTMAYVDYLKKYGIYDEGMVDK